MSFHVGDNDAAGFVAHRRGKRAFYLPTSLFGALVQRLMLSELCIMKAAIKVMHQDYCYQDLLHTYSSIVLLLTQTSHNTSRETGHKATNCKETMKPAMKPTMKPAMKPPSAK